MLKPASYLFVLLLCIFSCAGQPETELPGDSAIVASGPKIIRGNAGSEYDNIHCSLCDKNGNLWFGTTCQGVYRYDGKEFTNFTTSDGLSNNEVWSMMEDRSGNIWIGTSNGVNRYDGSSFTNFAGESGMSNGHVSALYEDEAGQLWIGTDENGMYVYDGKTFSNFSSRFDLAGNGKFRLNASQAIAQDTSGNIWFASWMCEGISRYDGTTLTAFEETEGLTDCMIHSILLDKSGKLWFGSRNHGVYVFDGYSFSNVTDTTGLNQSSVYSILQDKSGNIWFTTDDDGVWKYDGVTFTNFTTKDGLSNNSVFSVTEDHDGNLWFGTRGFGLCRYDGKTFTGFVEN